MQADILVSQHNRVKTISIHQPTKKNAINRDMSRKLLEVMQESAGDDSRVIILTGSGSDFCAGADLDPSTLQGGFDVTEFLRTVYNPLVLCIRNMNKPVIAKAAGSCVGVGFNFAMACDMVFASETAKFSQIFTRIGLSTDGGGAYFMLERLGYHKAFELMATGAIVDAEEAEKLGLVNRVMPEAELDAFVNETAAMLANGPFLAISHNKSNLRAALDGGLEAALDQEAVNQGKNFKSRDFMEGVMAFIQKRQPAWKGE